MQVCTKCGQEKEFTYFHKDISTATGYRKWCKKCRITYSRSKIGRIRNMYLKQKGNSRHRGHPSPDYTVDSLIEWCLRQEKFHILHNTWKMQGFVKNLTPTCDRMYDNKPYTLENLQLLTWEKNKEKGESDRKSGKSITNQMEAVVQYTKGGEYVTEYPSIAIACREVNAGTSNMSGCCNGNRKTCMGYIWRHKHKLRRGYAKGINIL